MDNISRIKPDMTVARQESLSPFGLLTQLFTTELMQRNAQSMGMYRPLRLAYLEEDTEEQQAAPEVHFDLNVDLIVNRLLKDEQSRKNKESKTPAQRILERIILREKEIYTSAADVRHIVLDVGNRRITAELPLSRQTQETRLRSAAEESRNIGSDQRQHGERIPARNRDTLIRSAELTKPLHGTTVPAGILRQVIPGKKLELASQSMGVPASGGWQPEFRETHPGYPSRNGRTKQDGVSAASILLPDVMRRRRENALAQHESGSTIPGSDPLDWLSPEALSQSFGDMDSGSDSDRVFREVRRAVSETLRMNQLRNDPPRTEQSASAAVSEQRRDSVRKNPVGKSGHSGKKADSVIREETAEPAADGNAAARRSPITADTGRDPVWETETGRETATAEQNAADSALQREPVQADQTQRQTALPDASQPRIVPSSMIYRAETGESDTESHHTESGTLRENRERREPSSAAEAVEGSRRTENRSETVQFSGKTRSGMEQEHSTSGKEYRAEPAADGNAAAPRSPITADTGRDPVWETETGRETAAAEQNAADSALQREPVQADQTQRQTALPDASQPRIVPSSMIYRAETGESDTESHHAESGTLRENRERREPSSAAEAVEGFRRTENRSETVQFSGKTRSGMEQERSTSGKENRSAYRAEPATDGNAAAPHSLITADTGRGPVRGAETGRETAAAVQNAADSALQREAMRLDQTQRQTALPDASQPRMLPTSMIYRAETEESESAEAEHLSGQTKSDVDNRTKETDNRQETRNDTGTESVERMEPKPEPDDSRRLQPLEHTKPAQETRTVKAASWEPVSASDSKPTAADNLRMQTAIPAEAEFRTIEPEMVLYENEEAAAFPKPEQNTRPEPYTVPHAGTQQGQPETAEYGFAENRMQLPCSDTSSASERSMESAGTNRAAADRLRMPAEWSAAQKADSTQDEMQTRSVWMPQMDEPIAALPVLTAPQSGTQPELSFRTEAEGAALHPNDIENLEAKKTQESADRKAWHTVESKNTDLAAKAAPSYRITGYSEHNRSAAAEQTAASAEGSPPKTETGTVFGQTRSELAIPAAQDGQDPIPMELLYQKEAAEAQIPDERGRTAPQKPMADTGKRFRREDAEPKAGAAEVLSERNIISDADIPYRDDFAPASGRADSQPITTALPVQTEVQTEALPRLLYAPEAGGRIDPIAVQAVEAARPGETQSYRAADHREREPNRHTDERKPNRTSDEKTASADFRAEPAMWGDEAVQNHEAADFRSGNASTAWPAAPDLPPQSATEIVYHSEQAESPLQTAPAESHTRNPYSVPGSALQAAREEHRLTAAEYRMTEDVSREDKTPEGVAAAEIIGFSQAAEQVTEERNRAENGNPAARALPMQPETPSAAAAELIHSETVLSQENVFHAPDRYGTAESGSEPGKKPPISVGSPRIRNSHTEQGDDRTETVQVLFPAESAEQLTAPPELVFPDSGVDVQNPAAIRNDPTVRQPEGTAAALLHSGNEHMGVQRRSIAMGKAVQAKRPVIQDIRVSNPHRNHPDIAAGKQGRVTAVPVDRKTSETPAQTELVFAAFPQPAETVQNPNPGKTQKTDALPGWAQELLQQTGTESSHSEPVSSGGVSRQKMPRQINWSAPVGIHPGKQNDLTGPQNLTFKEKQEAETEASRLQISDADLQRTADKIYRIIEERLRRELRRSGR